MPELYVPNVTPLRDDLSIDHDRVNTLARHLLEEGADGLGLFGTTGEANSFSVKERMETLEKLVGAGFPAEKIMPGTGMSALTDTVELSNHAAGLGCRRVLVLPPFYYKAITEEGLFQAFEYVVRNTQGSGVEILLYHIPPVAGVGFSVDLVQRLYESFPDRIVGIKDSGGDFAFSKAVLERCPGFKVFPGSERFLMQALKLGGAGCITATGNLNAKGVKAVINGWQGPEADELDRKMVEFRGLVESRPVIPALKATIGALRGEDGWERVRPPFLPAKPGSVDDIVKALRG